MNTKRCEEDAAVEQTVAEFFAELTGSDLTGERIARAVMSLIDAEDGE